VREEAQGQPVDIVLESAAQRFQRVAVAIDRPRRQLLETHLVRRHVLPLLAFLRR
jgi:hypothetical protein